MHIFLKLNMDNNPGYDKLSALCWQPWQNQILVIPKPISFCLVLYLEEVGLQFFIFEQGGFLVKKR